MILPGIRPNGVPLWRQQLAALWANTSPPVKCIGIIVILGYALSFVDGAVAALSVTPGYLLPPSFCVWTALTFWCMELHAWEVVVDIVTVGLCGKLIEPLWGRWEMVRFFWVTNAGVALLTALVYLVLYAGSGNVELLFEVHVHGLTGYVAGLSVAVRQIMPDLLIFRSGAGKFTNRNVPLTILLIGVVLWAVGLLDGTFPVMFMSGLLVSWVYLRFYQRHGVSSRGDSSDSFTFASFFPNVLQPAIDCLVAPLHVFCLRIGAIKRQSAYHPLTQVSVSRSASASTSEHNIHAGGSSTGSAASMPGLNDPQNIERRRQIALRALSERLSKTGGDISRTAAPKPPAVSHSAAPIPVATNADGETVSLVGGTAASHPRFPRPVLNDAGRRVPFTFEVPAIALPPPPPSTVGGATATAASADNRQ